MDLGLDLHATAISYIADYSSLKNETKTLLREVHFECDMTAHNHNQIKVKIKEVRVEVKNISMEKRHNDLGWSEDR